MDGRPVAAFDIDGTVFRSSLFHELVEALVAEGILPDEVRRSYAAAQTRWLNRQGTYKEYTDLMIEAFHASLRGIPYEPVERAALRVVEEKRHRLYRYTRDLVKDLKAEGYFLLAISYSPRFMVEPLCFELGFDKVYAFYYQTGPSGNFTGEVEDLELMLNKAAVLERAVRKEGLSMRRSIAVGDTESDISMLESVERAIAFNPNRTLYEHAKRREWKVVVERKDMIYEL